VKKKALAILLSLAMVFSLFPVPAFASGTTSDFSDRPSNWSTKALENAVSNGLLSGYGGKIMPNDNLTKAQMATIINRAFGATEKASLSSYPDVAANAWYYDDMAKAVQMKTFVGSGDKLNPAANITREEAFAVLARAFKLSGAELSALDKFSDKALVSSWAKDAVASLIAAGYIAGSNSQLNPKQNITRAEFAQIMDNILKNYIKTAGTYTTDYTGNVMINVPGVTLKDIKITGDLIIGDGVGNGDVTLDGITVAGRTIIRGGGINSIKIIGNSNLQNIIIARVDGQVRADDGEDDGKDITEDDESGNLGGAADTDIDYGYFTFNPTNGTITGYSSSGPKDVVIPSEINGVPVTVIGSGAFDNLDLSSLVLPNTIVTISDSAFAYNNLTNLVIPNSVENLNNWSFYMNNINNLSIGNKVKRIGVSAFEFSSLTSVTIPDSVTFLGDYAFRENKLTQIIIGSGASVGELFLTGFIIAPNNNFRDAYYPEKRAGTYIGTKEGTWTRLTDEQYFTFDKLTRTITKYDNRGGLSVGIPPNIGGVSVENIGEGAFADENLNRVIMQNTIKIIGDNAFSNNSLDNIIIPSGVTSIGDGSFANNHLEIVSIPSSVTTIGNSAFQHNSLASASIGSSVANIGSNAFSNNNLTALSLPGSLRSVGNSAFAYNNITEIKINAGVALDNNMLNAANNNFRDSYIAGGAGGYLATQSGTWIRLTDDKYFSFDSSTKTITGYNNAGGLAVVIPQSINGVQVIKIGDRAFVSKGLTSVVIPDTVTSLGYLSFGYNAISNVEFSNSLTEIGGRAFCGNLLSNLEIGDNVINIGDNAFSENQLINLTLNNKLKDIGDWAFWKNSIKEVIIPDSVTKIGLAAFAVNAITDVEIGDGLTEIDAVAFSYNEISNIIFGSNLAIIGEGVFRENQLTSLTIPASVTSIDRYAFIDNSLTNIVIPDNVTFSYCVFTNNNLSSITIGSGVILGEYLLNNDNNNFKNSYVDSGVYYGTQLGTWERQGL